MRKLLIAIMTIGTVLQAAAQTVSPLDFGLREATTGIGRYYALYNAHCEARDRGVEVSYDGIDSLDIELPPAWRTIPLARHTDFGGLVLTVTNNYRHGALFTMAGTAREIELDKALVDGLDFGSVPALAQGDHLLVLSDQNPWTERQGYGYKVYRKDIIKVHDGRGLNHPIAPWNTPATSLKASVYDVDTAQKVFGNLTMHRTRQSTYRTYCINVVGQQNVLIERVYVTTPKSRMIADGVFSISNCADICFADDTVHGTYSGYGRTRNYGYAFSLGNLYGTRFERVEASGNWGVFGTNNLSNTTLVDCDIDRFDIHCYGRDARLLRCNLHGRQTSVTSFFGTLVLDSCHMTDYTPVAVRASYNAYPPFDALIHDCTFELSPRYHAIVCVNLDDSSTNTRPELAEKCLPNIKVDGLKVVVPWTVRRLDIFNPDGNHDCLRREYGHAETVEIKGLSLTRRNGRKSEIPVYLSSRSIKTSNELKVISDIQVINNQ